jgi:hypothetical protein
VVNVLQRAVVIPQIEIIEERALGWKVFGNIAPLTARAQYIHNPVDDLAHIDFSLSPAMFGRTNQRRDVRPLLVRQIARITQLVTIVFGAVLACPHRRPLLNQAANLESHPIHPIQLLSGRTLRQHDLTTPAGHKPGLNFHIPGPLGMGLEVGKVLLDGDAFTPHLLIISF